MRLNNRDGRRCPVNVEAQADKSPVPALVAPAEVALPHVVARTHSVLIEAAVQTSPV